MVSGKKRGRPSKQTHQESQIESTKNETNEYEKMRQQRIKENKARMEQMGILELSKNLSGESQKAPHVKKQRVCQKKIEALPDSTRRSSRLNTMVRVNYAEKAHSPIKGGKAARNLEIHIIQGSEPEIYTAEHEKLLGDCKTKWALYVDGYDKNGKRIYDPVEGKGCHQCRQKTLGRRTQCSSCKIGLGQFCGDCLFMRYGENVIEVNKNPSWICPVCRGICNCSRCRLSKGWKPTGSIYKKVKHLGFKSVAHYLIQSQLARTIQEEPTKENPQSQNGQVKRSGLVKSCSLLSR
ncbi:Cell division cycle-associated 7-like protein [Heracleum sosnowskyi]|uniref:Cell division cycle-associated 7-like protein n=1 Tax=Heracleum sosnowskyi TaxID=360622 RepID=A0AAD8JDM9_9APIA|nr:Cell division cycle-associated 7-like protein [Heracleum sosnowskyi]